MEDAVFDSAGRLFHILAPRYEKHFCPFADFFFGNLKSVSVFQRLWEAHAEFFVRRLHRYGGAKSLSDLKTIILDSLSMSSSMVPAQLCNKWSAWDIKAAICDDSSSTILELLQLVGVCRSSTTPDRTTVSKVGLDNTSVKSSYF